MRKLSFLLLTVFTGIVLMSSCKKDDENIGSPTINFIGGAEYIDQDAILPEYTFFKVGIAASANVESGNKLTTLRLTRTMDNVTYVDTTFTVNDDQFNADFTFNVQQAGKTESIAFVITDKADQTARISLNITSEATGVAVSKTVDVMMGSFNDDYGSFYSTVNKMAYGIADASSRQADIDFLFYQGAVNGSTIASPADEKANEVYAISAWTTKNETLFAATTMSVEEFDAIGATTTFPEFTGTASSITQMGVGDVIMFKTVGQKLGFIKINQISSRGDYTSVDVIVAE